MCALGACRARCLTTARADIVFCRTWVPVEPKRFYNPVTSLLSDWKAMRTMGELRKANAVPVPANPDSEYKPVERTTRRFYPLKLPKSLEAALPVASKPKLQKKKANKGYASKRAVIMEAPERRAHTMMQQIFTMKKAKDAKRKVKDAERRERSAKKAAAEKAKFAPYVAAEKKRKYKEAGLKQLKAARFRAAKAARTGE